ncbi:hypothetical protein Bca4012_010307 [Brassica carinata]|uniref:Uncharacterized protein n=1 Tax=Brassica carinata TaxID=52824 RepID=A0A8X7S3Y6_BRACI|nr:hypothetical protein Bca52824_035275 [Brassica carinata]
MSRKFDHIDSRFNAYELDRNRPLVDQKTIDDMVKASVDSKRMIILNRRRRTIFTVAITAAEYAAEVTPPRANVIRVPVKEKEDRAATASEDESDVEHVTDEVHAEENEGLAESNVDSEELIRSAIVKEYREKKCSIISTRILAEGWVHDSPTYRVIPDDFKECWFLQLDVAVLISDARVEEEMGQGGNKPLWMLTRVWRDLVDMFEELGPDNFGFRQ